MDDKNQGNVFNADRDNKGKGLPLDDLLEELEILDSAAHDKVQGPFSNTKELMKFLKKAS